MKKAILTGHSRGLGAAIAEQLLARDISVLAISRAGNATLAGRLTEQAMDLSDTTALSAWLAGGALREFFADASTAIVINNAGLLQPVGPLPMQSPEAIAKAVALNVAAPLMVSAAFAADCPTNCDRRLLNVSSGAGSTAYAGWSVYCATKAALDHHARSVVLDATPSLRICSLAPGVIDTDMQGEIRATTIEQFPLRERFDAFKRDGVLQAPADCARRLVDYLLGDAFGREPVADLRAVGTNAA
ncbi:MAG: SDR family oxidoreductase [Burkholderiaceae bacterium]|nr:SDR family oxidoreductase [Burkholderiaceae bacterium]